MTQLGIYPGTFDPIHQGHIAFAAAAIADCKLDKVLFLPETHPRSKPNVNDIAVRFLQIKKALQGIPQLDILELTCTQFSVIPTLSEIQSATNVAHLNFLVGSDVLATMQHWPNITVLLETCDLTIGLRHGSNNNEVQKHIDELMRKSTRTFAYTIIETEHSHLASSHFR